MQRTNHSACAGPLETLDVKKFAEVVVGAEVEAIDGILHRIRARRAVTPTRA